MELDDIEIQGLQGGGLKYHHPIVRSFSAAMGSSFFLADTKNPKEPKMASQGEKVRSKKVIPSQSLT